MRVDSRVVKPVVWALPTDERTFDVERFDVAFDAPRAAVALARDTGCVATRDAGRVTTVRVETARAGFASTTLRDDTLRVDEVAFEFTIARDADTRPLALRGLVVVGTTGATGFDSWAWGASSVSATDSVSTDPCTCSISGIWSAYCAISSS